VHLLSVMKRKVQFYREFGSFNAGNVLITPVHPDNCDQIQLSLRIRGVRAYDFESIVVLVSGNPSTSKSSSGSKVKYGSPCVYKGICRFGQGLAGVHTLSILEGGEMVLHHSPSATLKGVASRHFRLQQPGSTATANGLPVSVKLPADTLLLTRDSDHVENRRTCSDEIIAEYRTYLIRRLPDAQPKAVGPEEEEDDDGDDGDDSVLYISPDASPHPRTLNEDDFSNMLNKYAKFGSTPLGELQNKLLATRSGGGSGGGSGGACGRNSGADDSSVGSAASNATHSTRSRLQDALHGNSGAVASALSPLYEAREKIASGAQNSGTATASGSGSGSGGGGDKALGIADRLLRGVSGSAGGTGSTVASVLSVDSLDRDKYHSDGRPRSSHNHSLALGSTSPATVSSRDLDPDLYHADGRPRRSSVRRRTLSSGASVASFASMENEAERDRPPHGSGRDTGSKSAYLHAPASSAASVGSQGTRGSVSSTRKTATSTPSYMQPTASVGLTVAARRGSAASTKSATTGTSTTAAKKAKA